jgi:RimJ/RimL family protein N-acetyltransferase
VHKIKNILRKAKIDDGTFVLSLRNKSYVQLSSWNTRFIDIKAHLNFWINNYKDYWIIQTERNHKPIGFVKIKDSEVGIAIDKRFWNQGYGKCALNELMKKNKKLKATIKFDNVHSLCFFIKCGFMPKGYILEKEEK